jgi:hypothetical protein
VLSETPKRLLLATQQGRDGRHGGSCGAAREFPSLSRSRLGPGWATGEEGREKMQARKALGTTMSMAPLDSSPPPQEHTMDSQ